MTAYKKSESKIKFSIPATRPNILFTSPGKGRNKAVNEPLGINKSTSPMLRNSSDVGFDEPPVDVATVNEFKIAINVSMLFISKNLPTENIETEQASKIAA